MKRDLLITAIAIVVIAAICYGLLMVRPELPVTPSEPFSIASMGAPEGEGAGNVVMRVNGEPVTEQEFHLFLQQLPEQMQGFAASPAGRRQIAEQIVRMKVLEQEGRRLGADKDPNVSSRVKFGRANERAQYAVEKITADNSEKALRDAYEKEKANLESMELSHILVAVAGGQVPPRNGQPLSAEQATQKAHSLAAQIRGGADFAAVARAQSDDTQSAEQGGSLGQVSPRSLPPNLAGPIAALRPGELSQPIRTEMGVHIFRAGPRTTMPFEQVKPMLQQRVQQELLRGKVEDLYRDAKVDFDPKFFPPAAPPAAAPPPARN